MRESGLARSGVGRRTHRDLARHAGAGSVRTAQLGLHVSGSPRCAGAGSAPDSGAHTVCGSKIAAAASALGLTVAMWNCLAGFAWPMALAPAGSGFSGTLRFIAAFWITLVAAGTFHLLRGFGRPGSGRTIAATVVSARLAVLQIGAVRIVPRAYLFWQPSLDTPEVPRSAGKSADARVDAPVLVPGAGSTSRAASSRSEGHAMMSPLALRAVVSLAIAILVAGGARSLLSYLRTLRKIVEEPDIVPGSRGGIWLPRFGNLTRDGADAVRHPYSGCAAVRIAPSWHSIWAADSQSPLCQWKEPGR